jgi:hypothetical protein
VGGCRASRVECARAAQDDLCHALS